MNLTGQADTDGLGWTLRGTSFDPSQGKEIPIRTAMRLDGKDHYVYSMFTQMPGAEGKVQEMKMMEISATRTQ